MDHEQRVWQILEAAGIGMLVTRFDGGMRARPLDARPDRDSGTILFLIDKRGLKDDEIAACPDVCFTIVNAHDKAYVSITGRARVFDDKVVAEKIWKRSDDVWWSGPNDVNLRVLQLDPHFAEMWDGPASSSVARYEFMKARKTGSKPNLGENRKITVDMA